MTRAGTRHELARTLLDSQQLHEQRSIMQACLAHLTLLPTLVPCDELAPPGHSQAHMRFNRSAVGPGLQHVWVCGRHGMQQPQSLACYHR